MSDRSDNRDHQDYQSRDKPKQSVQESILTVLAFDEMGGKIAEHLSAPRFDEGFSALAEALLDYWKQYHQPPGRSHLDDLFDPLIDAAKPEEKELYQYIMAGMIVEYEAGINPQFVADQIAAWLGRQLRKEALVHAGDLFQAGESSEKFDAYLLKKIQAAQSISMAAPPQVLSGSDFCALRLKTPELLIDPWLSEQTSVLVHSAAGEGKSCLMMHTAIYLAMGRFPVFVSDVEDDWSFRWQVMRPARVLYVDGEMSAQACQVRLRRFGRMPKGFYVLNKDQEGRRGSGLLGNLYAPEHRVRLDAYIASCRAEVVVLDNIFHLFNVSLERELEKWADLNTSWISAHKSAGRSLVFLHHEPKGSPGASFGSVIREVGVDVRMGLAPLKPQPTDGSTTREIKILKGRDLDSTQKASFVARLRLDKERNRYRWTAEDVAGGGRPGRPKSAEAEDRRTEILDLAAEGKSNREIATAVGVSEQYVSRVLKEAREAREGTTKSNQP